MNRGVTGITKNRRIYYSSDEEQYEKERKSLQLRKKNIPRKKMIITFPESSSEDEVTRKQVYGEKMSDQYLSVM